MSVELIQALLLSFAVVVILMPAYIRFLQFIGMGKRIQVELPDKYSRHDEFPAQDQGPALAGPDALEQPVQHLAFLAATLQHLCPEKIQRRQVRAQARLLARHLSVPQPVRAPPAHRDRTVRVGADDHHADARVRRQPGHESRVERVEPLAGQLPGVPGQVDHGEVARGDRFCDVGGVVRIAANGAFDATVDKRDQQRQQHGEHEEHAARCVQGIMERSGDISFIKK